MAYNPQSHPDRLLDVDGRQGLGMARAKRKVAHLSLHAARVARTAARDNPFLHDLLQHAVMERPPVPKGDSG